ncbi:MAG: heavy metal-responsive transcriptional regulator [Deltaproteobacteria bacterium]|nr:heavy metal-responsive transcriptional regulator [Deltaproteobacteria bacterium]
MDNELGVSKVSGYQIGHAAREAGVNVQTLRYYERCRLLTPRSRRLSGYRLYGDPEIRRIHFIKRAQELGFSLKEIFGLLNLRVTSAAQCDAVKRKAEEKLAQVEQKIRHLRSIQGVLKQLITSCHRLEPTERCPILNSLEKESSC